MCYFVAKYIIGFEETFYELDADLLQLGMT